ncbi:MAG: flagellar hook-length control protein FliK [Nitrospinae bacterium]|nr:flagellar hook-length control protein FliK [Nitrospinota bacterium]
METAFLAADLLSQLQTISQSSTPNGNSDVEVGENDFPVYFNEAMNREIADKPDSPLKDNLPSEVYSTEGYSEDTSSKDLGIQLQAVVNESNIMEVNDTVITEMNAAIFLSIQGFSSRDIETALQSAGEANSSSDIKAVDFLKNLGLSEDAAKEMVAQVIAQVNSVFNSGQIEKINSENSITPLLKLSQNYNEIVNNIKQIASDEPQQKTISSVEKAFSEPVFEPLQKGDTVNPLRIQQTDSGALDTLKEIKDIISKDYLPPVKFSAGEVKTAKLSDKSGNIAPFDGSGFDGESIDSLPTVKISTGELKTTKLSDKSGNIAPLLSAMSHKEGKEQNIDSDLSGGDNFSLGAKEYTVLKQGDSTGKAGAENIAQSQKTIIDKTVINQIVEKAAIFIRGEKNEIKIHLEPPSLGSVHIKVSMESHNMKATMVTDTPAVKEVIESNLGDLKRSLSDAGIKVDQFSVLVGSGYDYKNGGHDLIHQMEKADVSEHESVNANDKKIDAAGNINSQNIINIFI